jgi:hypothetical protein
MVPPNLQQLRRREAPSLEDRIAGPTRSEEHGNLSTARPSVSRACVSLGCPARVLAARRAIHADSAVGPVGVWDRL